MSASSPQTATLASVAANAASVTILAATNSGRRAATIVNDGSTTLYLAFAATATTTAYTVQIAASGYYEFSQPCYGGVVSGIWAGTPTGSARTTVW